MTPSRAGVIWEVLYSHCQPTVSPLSVTVRATHPPSPAKCFQSALPFLFHQPHENQVRQRKKWESIRNCKTKEVSEPFEQPRGGCVEPPSSPCWAQVMVLLFGPEHSWLSEVPGQIPVSAECQPAGAVPKQLLKLLFSRRAYENTSPGIQPVLWSFVLVLDAMEFWHWVLLDWVFARSTRYAVTTWRKCS